MSSGLFHFSVYPDLPVFTALRPPGDTLFRPFSVAMFFASLPGLAFKKKSPSDSRACAITTRVRHTGSGVGRVRSRSPPPHI